jgi:hypothetical protein
MSSLKDEEPAQAGSSNGFGLHLGRPRRKTVLGSRPPAVFGFGTRQCRESAREACGAGAAPV